MFRGLNFIVVPPLAWLLARFLPPDPALLLGVYLVLLAPCTDWFVSFTLLGKGTRGRPSPRRPCCCSRK